MNVFMSVFGNFGRKCIMSEDGTTNYDIGQYRPKTTARILRNGRRIKRVTEFA